MRILEDHSKAEIEEMAESLQVVLENDPAVQFCCELLSRLHLWDDLVDGQERSTEHINETFVWFLSMRENPFFLRYESHLMPLLYSCILQWTDANVIEGKKEESQYHKAYMLRAFIYQIWAYCAFLLKGYDGYQKLQGVMQEFYQEEFDQYVKDL